MASQAFETVVVERVSKFGFLANGVWYGLSKKSGLTVATFTPGTSVKVKVFTTDEGKKYVMALDGPGDTPANVVTHSTPVVISTPTVKSAVPYQANSESKDKRIAAHGVIQAAIQAPVLQMFSTNYDEWWALVTKTAANALVWIKENS
jgi:hypothetical protein